VNNYAEKESYQWQGFDKVVYVGHTSGSNNFIHRHLATVVTILDVLTNTAVKQDWFLWDETNLGSQPLNTKLSDIITINHLQHNSEVIVFHSVWYYRDVL